MNDLTQTPDIQAGRLPKQVLADNFQDIHEPLTKTAANIEAERCYFCYDAPCVKACPTRIDIPLFIRQIHTNNVKGAAKTILSANIMGGMCARVCPTENLCEGACVRSAHEDKPVVIGLLQRHATDTVQEQGQQFFARSAETGKHIAVVGAGPAGMSCAHKLATYGHKVTVFEERKKAGGLNEYGIASYKTINNFAQKEMAYIMSIGGITLKTGKSLGKEIDLEKLRQEFDAVFLSIGLQGVHSLGIKKEDAQGIQDAVKYIAELRQSEDLSQLKIGRKVVVIGGGMTAIDIAVQSKLLGAEDVTIAYRRGKEQMGASEYEQELAQTKGVKIKYWSQPYRVIADAENVTGIELEYTELKNSKLSGTGETYALETDTLFKAIGQNLGEVNQSAISDIKVEKGKIKVNEKRQTSVSGIWAGGDCINNGFDLTVAAVEDGKVAAIDIHEHLSK